jgi:sugar lactone lactonase YvrE
MNRARNAERSNTNATRNRGVASRILHAVSVSPSLEGTGAPVFDAAPLSQANGRRLICSFAASLALLIALAAVLLVPAAASAAPKGVVGVLGVFSDQPGSGDGEFSNPIGGVAVSEGSGEVYVVDTVNSRVQRFAADGTFISQFGVSGSFEGGEFAFDDFSGSPPGIAVAPDGSVYVADLGNQRVQKFTADGTFVHMFGLDVDASTGGEVCTAGCQFGTAGSGDGEFSGPVGVAVEADGDVLVADRDNQRIQRFDSSGVYQSQFEVPFAPHRVAVDSSGAIYVLEFNGQVLKFDSTGGSPEVFAPDHIASARDLATAGDRVFVAQPDAESPEGDRTPEILEFDPALDPADQLIETHPVAASEGFGAGTFGLAAHSSGRLYLAVDLFARSQAQLSRVLILDEGTAPPAIVTLLPASDVTATTATLRAEIDSNGPLPTNYRLEVSAGGVNWTTVGSGSVPGDTAETVSANATDLDPNTLYRFRVVTTKGFGNPDVNSPELTFLTDATAPEILESRPGPLDATSATLLGRIDPNGSATRYRFSYGIGAFTHAIPVPEAPIGFGSDPVFVSQVLSGLKPNTTYQFRLVATSPAGVTTGPTKTFTTRTTPALPDNRGYELVSPAYKVFGAGVGHLYGGRDAAAFVGTPSAEGERFAVNGQNGSMLVDGTFAYVNDVSLAERTDLGWMNKPAFTKPGYGSHYIAPAALTSFSDDFSLMQFNGDKPLKMFPEMKLWGGISGTSPTTLMLRQWTGPEWELLAPLDGSDPSAGNDLTRAKSTWLIAGDGSGALISGIGRGLAGPEDPTLDMPDSNDNGRKPRSIYLDEITGPFTSSFPGDDGRREVVHLCSPDTVLPSGPCEPPAPGRDGRLTSLGGAALIERPDGGMQDLPPPISRDGSRVFFMSPDPAFVGGSANFGPAQLFVRQRNSDGSLMTRWISRSEVPGQVGLEAPAIFQGASRDGDKVFFKTIAPLTADDPNGQGGPPPPGGVTAGPASPESSDLYMYDLPDGANADPAGGDLVRITSGPDGDGDCHASVDDGSVVEELGQPTRFVSDDASRVYFVCQAPLTGVPASDNGAIAGPGTSTSGEHLLNLYSYDRGRPLTERWRFVARLDGQPSRDACAAIGGMWFGLIDGNPGGTGETLTFVPGASCVNGTTDGGFVTFMASSRLTADDPDSNSFDIYGYDAVRGELTRITAPQGGAGGSYPCSSSAAILCHGDIGFGYFPHLVAATGRDGERLAFFHSRGQLVAEDNDGAYDVYVWRDGELSLVSTGASDTDGAFYVGNDRSGQNVYFATRDQLTWQDKDRVLDVYTARVDGGIPEPAPPEVCAALADACQGGGAGVVSTQPRTPSLGGEGDADRRARKTLDVSRLSARDRRRASRTGRLRVSIRTSEAGRVTVLAKGRVGKRVRRIARGSVLVRKPGRATLVLRLAGPARAQLRGGKALRVTLRVSSPGARSRTMAVRLPGAGS